MLILLLTGALCRITAQDAANFSVTHFGETEGLRSNKVTTMLQDSRGYAWFGTVNGLYRYDGYHFKVYRRIKDDANSLPGNAVTKLAEDRDGKIWVGMVRAGLSCYDPAAGTFTHYPIQATEGQQAATPAVSALYIDQDNTVWAGVQQKGLFRLDRSSGKYQQYNIIPDSSTRYPIEIRPVYNSVYGVHQEKKGVYWLATHDGLYRFEPATCSMTPVRTTWPGNAVLRDDLFTSIVADGQGLWLGSWAGGLSYYNIQSGQWENYKFSKRNKNIGTTNIIMDIKVRNEQELWIASNDAGLGVFNKQTKRFNFWPDDNDAGIPSKLVEHILSDNQQNLWAGHVGGLSRIRERDKKFLYTPVKVQHTDNGAFYAITSLQDDRAGRYQYMGTAFADGLHAIDKQTGQTITLPFQHMPGDEAVLIINDIIQDSKGVVWVLARDYVYQYDPVRKMLLMPPQPPAYSAATPSNNFITLREDPRGRIWIATERNGLFCYDPQKQQYQHYFNGPGSPLALPSNVIRTIAIDRRGRVWIGNRRGSFGYLDDSLKQFVNPDTRGALSQDARKNHVYALYADRDGDIWAGTDGGVLHYNAAGEKPALAKVYNGDNGLQEEVTFALQGDAEGNIWTISPPNLCMIHKSNGSVTTYGKPDGLDKVGLANGLSLLRDGNMAILTAGGYYTFNPQSFPKKSTVVPLLITTFKVDDKEVYCEYLPKGASTIEVPPGVNVISFEYAALDYNRPDKQEYAYMLEGFDKDWVMAGQRRYAGYANIPGGDYVFKVKATNMPGNWHTPEVLLAIHVRSPFYKTWWFMLAVALTLATSLYVFYKAKLGQQQQILQLETKTQQLEKEKTLVMYENLKQHLNPHFLFNSLTSLSSLIRIDQKMAGNFLDKMSRIYRYILKNRDSEVVPLRDELKFVQMYIELQVTRFDQGLRINNTIGDDFLDRKIAPVTLQNLVENAIKHNLVDTESPLVIDMFVENDYLVVRNNLQKKNFVETSNKQGLANMLSLYRFLCNKPMIIEEDATWFTVRIPLL
ncbi:sensor histidine kinase [Paraflavitalea pollutisoli]|uniref:sensor histidine kinase n=1 Tax=Paraflavitalea pollutisoli TaxID=3034143 RepID=UPI0023EB7AC4|nr:sensor histidine kinase [Paraflavitalea sp. H1-2-19X]